MTKAQSGVNAVHRDRQRRLFVGRSPEAERFRSALNLPGNSDDRPIFLLVSGQSGIGKSDFLAHCRDLATQEDALSAWSDEDQESLVDVIQKLADDLGGRRRFWKLRRALRRYRKQRQVLEGRDDAPEDLARTLASFVSRGAAAVTRELPGAANAVDLIEEPVTEHAQNAAAFVARHLKSSADRELVMDPINHLTPLLLGGLKDAASKKKVVLFLDTFEENRRFLEPWLLSLCRGERSSLPASVLVCIAGQETFESAAWVPFADLIERVQLTELPAAEAKELLQRRGVVDESDAAEIMRLSHGIPILLASLAIGQAGDPQGTETFVERLLRSVRRDDYREAALTGSACRLLNLDVIRVLFEKDAEPVFEWLTGTPLVTRSTHGWRYHAVIREQLAAAARLRSQDDWRASHQVLADYYAKREADAIGQGSHAPDYETIQRYAVERTYHLIACGDRAGLFEGLERFGDAWRSADEDARRWALAVKEGETDSGSSGAQWGPVLLEALEDRLRDHPETGLKLFTRMVDQSTLPEELRAHALLQRSDVHRSMRRYDEALADVDRALRLRPNDLKLKYHRSWIYEKVGQLENALEDCDDVLQGTDPSGALAGVTSVQRIRVTKKLKGPRAALTLLDAMIETNPHPWALLTRGQTRLELGEAQDAVADFTRTMDLQPTYRHEALKEIGRAHAQAGELELAERALQDSLAAQVRCGYCWRELAEVCAHHRDEDAGVALLRDTCADQDDPSVHAYRGWGLLSVGWYEPACEELDVAIDADPENALFRYWRALALGRSGLAEEADRELDEALRLRPGDPDVLGVKGYRLIHAGEVEAGLNVWKRAEAADPRQVDDANNRGMELSRAEAFSEAIDYFALAAKSSRSEEEIAMAKYNLAVATARRDGTQAATDEIEAAKEALGGLETEVHRLYAEASFSALEGKQDEAISRVSHAASEDEIAINWVLGDPAWHELRNDPRLMALASPFTS